MELKKTTFMQTHLIQNTYNNISGLSDSLTDNYDYIEDILDDLEYAYENKKENYLMNITHENAVRELIEISKNYNILTNSYPSKIFNKYKTIGIKGEDTHV